MSTRVSTTTIYSMKCKKYILYIYIQIRNFDFKYLYIFILLFSDLEFVASKWLMPQVTSDKILFQEIWLTFSKTSKMI